VFQICGSRLTTNIGRIGGFERNFNATAFNKLEKFNHHRRNIAEFYYKELKDTSFVTKLVKNDYTSQTEYDVSNLLKGKDGFLLIQKKCSITSKNIKRTMAKDCDLIEKKDPHIDSKYLLLYSKFINGEELVDYMKDNFTINKMMKSFCFLCKQIETLIDCKIIHHDLHFGNIMVAEDGQLKLIDFGKSSIQLGGKIFSLDPTPEEFCIDLFILNYIYLLMHSYVSMHLYGSMYVYMNIYTIYKYAYLCI
jgi:serine/threonine protein kinase